MAQGHSHGLVHASIKRSREGVQAVALALVVLAVTAAAQAIVFVASGSVAAPGTERYRGVFDDCVHNLQHPERGGG